MLFKQSPYWTFWAHDVNHIEIRHSEVSVHVDKSKYHDLKDLQAFNTDGFDGTLDSWLV